MHEDWVVCAFVSLGEAQLFIGERVNPMLVDEPVARAAVHFQEPCAVGVITFRTPERYRARAMNSGSLNTSAMMPLAALSKSPPTKSTSRSFMCAKRRCRSEVAASRFLATTSCRCTVHRVIVLGAPTGGLRRCPETTKALRPHVVLLVDSSMIGYLTESGRNVSLLRRMAKTSVVRVRVELVRDAQEMVVCLLQQHSAKGAAHDCDELCGLATGCASVPL